MHLQPAGCMNFKKATELLVELLDVDHSNGPLMSCLPAPSLLARMHGTRYIYLREWHKSMLNTDEYSSPMILWALSSLVLLGRKFMKVFKHVFFQGCLVSVSRPDFSITSRTYHCANTLCYPSHTWTRYIQDMLMFFVTIIMPMPMPMPYTCSTFTLYTHDFPGGNKAKNLQTRCATGWCFWADSHGRLPTACHGRR